MRNASIIAASILLFALLTWSALRSINIDTASAQMALRQLDIFAATESTLHRDMLRARAGQLRNYDPLAHEIERLHRTIEDLYAAMPADAEYKTGVDRLNDMLEQQERWTEQFKSQNALLQNSLAYFNIFSTRLRQTSKDSTLVLRASGVATALLHLLSDSSQTGLSEFDDTLNELTLDNLSPVDRDLAKALISHAKLLRTVLPETDRILRSMLTIPSKVQQDRLRGLVAEREAASEERAAFYRRILYGVSLILVGLTVCLALRLQSRARTLQRIARIEHVIAGISTRFIRVQSDDLADDIERALEELADCIDADRAYYVTANEDCNYRWSREGIAWPPGWPDKALEAIVAAGEADDGIIYRPKIDQLRPSSMPPDVRGWLCVPRMCGELVGGVLAFDSTREGMKAGHAECRLFRMACDALANAVESEALTRERQRLDETLQQARRLDTIGAFASGIAHNFNNIVGAILGYTEMAQFQLESGRAPSGHLLEIRRAGERARDLVDQILKFGRQTSLGQEDISLSNLLSETTSLLRASLPHRIALSVDQDKSDIAVRGQPEQLQQVVLNVCNNAAQAIDGAGSISIALRLKNADSSLQLDHGAVPPGNYAIISVMDTGRGMDEATREQMFDPFFTTRSDGNGLGLATVHEIVLSHGGAVSVNSTPDAGTRFDIWLPCLDRPFRALGATAKKNFYEGGETILLFEADRERLLRHEEIIAALGFEPVGFVDANSAVEALRVRPSRFDAAVICHLHGTSAALDVARALSRTAPFIPIILATASAGDLGARLLATVGVCEVVRYPMRSGEVSGALARCMANTPRSKGALII